MDEKQKQIDGLKAVITNLESELQAARRTLFELTDSGTDQDMSQADVKPEQADGRVIEGTFNGENMVGPQDKIFPVPANYASKSKLVEGDRLKLTIDNNGSFVFKQIGPVERKKLIGDLIFDNNAYVVDVDGGRYNVLYASVTYHKAKPGDKVAIELPARDGARWCVLESVIHDLESMQKTESGKPQAESPTGLDSTDIAHVSDININKEPTPNTDMLTPPVTDSTATDEGLDKVRSTLGINDFEIVGPKGTPAPDAVNPQSEEPTPSTTPLSSNSTTVDTRADAITEQEI